MGVGEKLRRKMTSPSTATALRVVPRGASSSNVGGWLIPKIKGITAHISQAVQKNINTGIAPNTKSLDIR